MRFHSRVNHPALDLSLGFASLQIPEPFALIFQGCLGVTEYDPSILVEERVLKLSHLIFFYN